MEPLIRLINPHPVADNISRVYIPKKVYEKIMAYANSVDGEISGFGKTKIINNCIKVEQIYLFKQECSTCGTTLNKEELGKFIYNIVKNGKNPKDYNLWWHTHYDFDVYFSVIDTTTIASLVKNSMLLSICVNKFGEIVARIDNKGYEKELPVVIGFSFNKRTKRYMKEARRKVNGGENK